MSNARAIRPLLALAVLGASTTFASRARAEVDGDDLVRIVLASTLTTGGIVGTAVGGALASDEVDTIEAHCPDRICDRTGYDAVARGQTAGTLATVSAFVAGASAIWLTLELVTLDVEEDPDDGEPKPLLPEKQVRASIRPIAGGGAATLELTF